MFNNDGNSMWNIGYKTWVNLGTKDNPDWVPSDAILRVEKTEARENFKSLVTLINGDKLYSPAEATKIIETITTSKLK